MTLPRELQKLATEIDGWLDLREPLRALELLPKLVSHPGARPIGLHLLVRALMDAKRYADAVRAIDELRGFDHDAEWSDVTEGWCRKRMADLPGAIACMERLLARTPRSALGRYNLGCYLALAGDADRAIDELTRACGMDPRFRLDAVTESDLDSLRADPRFRAVLPPGQR